MVAETARGLLTQGQRDRLGKSLMTLRVSHPNVSRYVPILALLRPRRPERPFSRLAQLTGLGSGSERIGIAFSVRESE